jgi:UDP-N-acetylglucosamine acyltransferase
MSTIHTTAVVEEGATLGKDVVVGPFCHVSANVTLEDGVKLRSHVVVDGKTRVGANTEIYPFASIGTPPQDLKFKGEQSTLEIGANNQIREHVTMNPGTKGGGLNTKVGDNCLFMMGAHVAHDCQIGDHVILANNATLAGHVTVGDFAIIGGLSAIHQFVRIGHHAMIGGMSGIENDVIPFGQAAGERANLVGLNLVGLKRRQFSREEISELRSAYRTLFSREGTMHERVEDVKKRFKNNETIMDVVAFMNSENSRSICQPKDVATAV